MKTKRVFRYFLAVALGICLAGIAQNAMAQSINEPLPGIVNNSRGVIAPFWQVGLQQSGESYTFIAITHPSLSNMHSRIGLTATAFLGDGSATSTFGTSIDFTVNAGATERLFLFGTPQTSGAFTVFPTLVSNNQAQGIVGTSNGGLGYIRFDPIATDPTSTNGGDGFQDITMLSFWGAVVFEGVNTGFAMEFIGDANDSAAAPVQGSGRFPAGLN